VYVVGVSVVEWRCMGVKIEKVLKMEKGRE
jgi:hypothetical protein